MTSWTEAIEQYRKEKAEAEKRKAERDAWAELEATYAKAWPILQKWREENGSARE